MAKPDKLDKEPQKNGKPKKKDSLLHTRTKKWIKATVMFLIAVIFTLSFFDLM